MDASPQTLRSLVHQAVTLVEELHTRGLSTPAPSPSRWFLLDPEEDTPPKWLKPNANRDLAARVAYGLAVRTTSRVGCLAVGESAIHAVTRMWLLAAEVEAWKVPAFALEEADFPRLILAAGRISKSPLIFSDRDVPRYEIQQATRQFVEESQVDFLVVDDPDVPTLRSPSRLPEVERSRVRMEFREAVRGTDVRLILPG